MGILDKHQKQEIRFQSGDLIMYNPTDVQVEEFKNVLSESFSINQDLSIDGGLNLREIRFIISSLTNIGSEINELSDEELLQKIDNGDRQLTLLLREIERYIYEFVEDMSYEQEKSIKFINSSINIINSNADNVKMKEKVNRLLKKNKITATIDELMAVKDNPEKITELISKSKVK